jgi:hypothetical protein
VAVVSEPRDLVGAATAEDLIADIIVALLHATELVIQRTDLGEVGRELRRVDLGHIS